MSNVVKFEPVEIGDGYRFDPDEILDAAKGLGFTILAVLGETADGEFWVSGTANVGETLVLLEKAKRRIVFGE